MVLSYTSAWLFRQDLPWPWSHLSQLCWLWLPPSFPHSSSLANSSLGTHGGGVWCQTSYSLPPSRSVGRSFWKNYSDICMCHGYKAPALYPPTLSFPCQPAPHLCCPSFLHLRQSFLKLLNMANCVRREAHFIWIVWLEGDLPCIGEELRKDVWKKVLQLDSQVSLE